MAARLLQVIVFLYRGCFFTAVTRGRGFEEAHFADENEHQYTSVPAAKACCSGHSPAVSELAVSKPLWFEPLELCLSEEPTPQVIVFSEK